MHFPWRAIVTYFRKNITRLAKIIWAQFAFSHLMVNVDFFRVQLFCGATVFTLNAAV
jgi:hypothetical protein